MPRLEVIIAWSIAFLPAIVLFVAYVTIPRRWLPILLVLTTLLALSALFVYFDTKPGDQFRFNEAIGRLAVIELAVTTALGLAARWLKGQLERRGSNRL
jgi:hypothetical protein